jgi:hypothetical protein
MMNGNRSGSDLNPVRWDYDLWRGRPLKSLLTGVFGLVALILSYRGLQRTLLLSKILVVRSSSLWLPVSRFSHGEAHSVEHEECSQRSSRLGRILSDDKPRGWRSVSSQRGEVERRHPWTRPVVLGNTAETTAAMDQIHLIHSWFCCIFIHSGRARASKMLRLGVWQAGVSMV